MEKYLKGDHYEIPKENFREMWELPFAFNKTNYVGYAVDGKKVYLID